MSGRTISVLVDQKMEKGVYGVDFDTRSLAQGVYLIVAYKNGAAKQTIKVVKN
jgi:hypothetical protein